MHYLDHRLVKILNDTRLEQARSAHLRRVIAKGRRHPEEVTIRDLPEQEVLDREAPEAA
jgi:hypothetical protein